MYSQLSADLYFDKDKASNISSKKTNDMSKNAISKMKNVWGKNKY